MIDLTANALVWLGAAAVPVLLNGMNVVRKNRTVRLSLVVSATVLLAAVLFAAVDVVIIKVNGQWNQRGGTSTDLVGAIVRAILDHPAGFRGEVRVTRP